MSVDILFVFKERDKIEGRRWKNHEGERQLEGNRKRDRKKERMRQKEKETS